MNISEIEKMASTLLKQLGYEDYVGYYGSAETIRKHSGYGLTITKRKGNTVKIEYQDKLVFDGIDNTYISGEWEEILKLYYEKMPSIIKKERAEEEKRKKCESIRYLLENPELLGRGDNETSFYINDDIMLTKIKGKNDDGTTTTMKVYDKGIEVYHCYKYWGYRSTIPDIFAEYLTYVPGEWENELESYKKKKIEEKQKEKTLTYLNDLKRL